MPTIKALITYLFWIVLSLITGIVYARCIINPNAVSEEGLWYLLHLFFEIGMLQVGFWVGLTIAICFILVDIFYLKKKLKNNHKKTLSRLVAFLIITVFVAIVHYILEKGIDVI